MPVIRINHFKAKQDKAEELGTFMQNIMSTVKSLPGCKSVRLLHSTEHPENYAVIEEWDSVDAHQKAAATATQATLDTVRSLIARPPVGEYYQ